MSRAKGQKTSYKTPIDHLKAVITAQVTKRVNRKFTRELGVIKRMIDKYEKKYKGGESK